MKAWLLQQGYLVSRKRVRRLMRLMGLEAIYRRPNTSKPAPGHRIFPYLLKGVEVNRVDQVWTADITYIPMAKGFLYLVAIMDWHSRHVLAWKLSNTMDTSFCVAALEEALGKGRPEIFNTDQGRTFCAMPRQRTNYRRRTYDFPERPKRFQEESGLFWSEIARPHWDLSPNGAALEGSRNAAQQSALEGAGGGGRQPGTWPPVRRV